MYTRAIVRKPCLRLEDGLTTSDMGKPNYDLALRQHSLYVNALEECGLNVTVLDKSEHYPDSVFVEDTAILTPNCAIITRPGAKSRRGEVVSIRKTVNRFYSTIYEIESPGHLDGGDILMVGSHFYIGLSSRTDTNGAEQLIKFLNEHNMTGETVQLKEMLHLKSGVAYLENDLMVIGGEFTNRSPFRKFQKVEIPGEEAYAANCIWVNDRVLVADGFPVTIDLIRKSGHKVIPLNMSEFEKLDGGLSCLSLRF